jgi:DNA-binding IclR family transcriptional regulator
MRLVDRTVRAMHVVADAPTGLLLTEVAARLELSPSTAHRLLGALAEHRLVYQGDDRRFRIGPGLVRLAQAFERQAPLLGVAKPVLDSLSRQINETVFLSELVDGDVICVATAEVARLLTFYMRMAERTPYHAGASARAILAFCPEEFIQDRLRNETLTKFTARTPTTYEEARAVLELTRRTGYAVCDEEMEVGVTAVSVPIFDYRGKATAALTVVAPSDRLAMSFRDDVVDALQHAASTVSSGLGYEPQGQEPLIGNTAM